MENRHLGAVSARTGGKERSLGSYIEDDLADTVQVSDELVSFFYLFGR